MRDIFLKIEGIKGEAHDKSHKDEIDILSWSWNMSQSGTTHLSGGGGTGKVQVNDLTVVKYIDKATPNLMAACCSGKHINHIQLTMRKAGENPVEYLKITMKECLISSVSSSGSNSGDLLTETVGLNFAEFKVEYTPQKEDGSKDASVEMGWDIKKNVKM